MTSLIFHIHLYTVYLIIDCFHIFPILSHYVYCLVLYISYHSYYLQCILPILIVDASMFSSITIYEHGIVKSGCPWNLSSPDVLPGHTLANKRKGLIVIYFAH